jgi:flagellin-like protein
MNLKQLFADDDAVSPVIGVILMVAITVILAAVIGTFVLNLGDNLQQTSPTASFSFEEDTGNSDVSVSHDGGDTIPHSNIKITLDDSGEVTGVWDSGGEVTAGDSVTFNYGGSDNVVKVIWESDDGSNSQKLDEYEIQG